jgi:hypothetical protein
MPLLLGNFASAGQPAVGGEITVSGGYVYHAFKSTGTFTLNSFTTLNAEYLVVGGGGNGGGNGGGGGGAGGLRYGTITLQPQTSYTAIVGASMTDSSFASIVSTRGGQGQVRDSNVGNGTGGSGGGGGGAVAAGTNSWALGQAGNTPSTSPSQGNNGGNGTGANGTGDQGCRSAGGGGGGYTAVGSPASSNVLGNGGNGTSAYSTWGAATGTGHNISGTYWFAGGGGGGSTNFPACNQAYESIVWSTGGNGGGSGANDAVGLNYANTGGGGAGGNTRLGANNVGASGVVIVRYPV